jgi:hypothetical protein
VAKVIAKAPSGLRTIPSVSDFKTLPGCALQQQEPVHQLVQRCTKWHSRRMNNGISARIASELLTHLK